MSNLLLMLGIIALSNGNISLFDNNKNKSKTKKVDEVSSDNNLNREGKIPKERSRESSETRRVKKVRYKKKVVSEDDGRNEGLFRFDINDINKAINLMDLSDEDLDRGMEIITRTKKYMTKEERKILMKLESLLDLVKGIKKLSGIDEYENELESNFFRSMDEEDKKNMMIKEILEVFPEKRKESVEKAMDMKKKIDLFSELFLPDNFGEGGFSLSSLANINNLGSINNLKLLGSLLRSSDDSYEENKYDDDNDEYAHEEYEDD